MAENEQMALLPLLLKNARAHAVILLDGDGIIREWLAGSEEIFGYGSRHVVGRNFSMLFTPEDREQNVPQLEMEIALSGREAENDRWMLRRDGVRFWATGVLTPLRDDHGTFQGFGKVLRNRTDLKGRLEASEGQQRFLQTAIDQKNTFLATLSHELRNPLSAIASSLRILERSGATHEEAIFARTMISRQLAFIRKMIEDLLDVTRIGIGRINLQKEKVLLNDIVRAAVDTCLLEVQRRQQNIQLIMEEFPLVVEGDPTRLQQVTINLIQNASKYSEDGKSIWVKVFAETDEAVLKIDDEGIGIAPEMLPRIFDLFIQADSNPQTRAGLGIGLSVVKNLVDEHGGTILVQSNGIGKGSEFTVRLPLLKSADALD